MIIDSREYNGEDEFLQDDYDIRFEIVSDIFNDHFKNCDLTIMERTINTWNSHYNSLVAIHNKSLKSMINLFGVFDEIIIDSSLFEITILHHDGRNYYKLNKATTISKKEIIALINKYGDLKEDNTFNIAPSRLNKKQLIEILVSII